MPSRPGTPHPRAAVFDVDGTLADTERDLHRPAFNDAFARFGLAYRWGVEEYGELLETAGGRSRIERYLAARGHPGDVAELAGRLHRTKTDLVRERIGGRTLQPRAGVAELLDELAAAGVTLSVCTTGRRAWVMPLLAQLFGADRFAVVVTGDDVPALKPAPDAYLHALDRLGLPATRAVAVEDSGNGLVAARRAGLGCWVVRNDYTRQHDFTGALGVFDGYGRPGGLTADHVLQHGRPARGTGRADGHADGD